MNPFPSQIAVLVWEKGEILSCVVEENKQVIGLRGHEIDLNFVLR